MTPPIPEVPCWLRRSVTYEEAIGILRTTKPTFDKFRERYPVQTAPNSAGRYDIRRLEDYWFKY